MYLILYIHEALSENNETVPGDLNQVHNDTTCTDTDTKVDTRDNVVAAGIHISDRDCEGGEVARDLNQEEYRVAEQKREKETKDQLSQRMKLLSEGFIIDTFLQETASQLTYYGLLNLYSVVKERL